MDKVYKIDLNDQEQNRIMTLLGILSWSCGDIDYAWANESDDEPTLVDAIKEQWYLKNDLEVEGFLNQTKYIWNNGENLKTVM